LAESSNEAKRLAREFEKSEKELEQIRSVTLNKLKPLGVEDLPASEFTAFVGALESRLDKWQKNLTALEESEKQISRLQNDEKSQAGVIELLKDSLNEKVVLIDQTEGLCEEITAQRHELFADKNPDREEEQLEKAVEKHEATAGEQREAKEACLHQTQQIKTIITTLKDEVEKRQPLLAKQEESFVASLKQQGFADEKNFVASRLGTAERQALAQRAKQLEDHHAEILANKKDRSARLAGEIELKLSTEPLEELQERQQQFKETLQQLTLRTGALKQQLEDNKRAKSLLKDKLALISSQKRELQRWEMLNKLIGSESGRKYQKFAQSLTFELLIAHANQQLITLSDRYLLMQDQENALELCVIDNYQAGEERSTKNLSGGESFIVSLALALGLSQMASRNVRVDSLFLDEGFGTLDEDALESALTTLANLHQEGKLIGVISHVPVLKDRISTQINVVAGDGGKSTLSGPGCARA
jgi:exonuclease SbcC